MICRTVTAGRSLPGFDRHTPSVWSSRLSALCLLSNQSLHCLQIDKYLPGCRVKRAQDSNLQWPDRLTSVQSRWWGGVCTCVEQQIYTFTLSSCKNTTFDWGWDFCMWSWKKTYLNKLAADKSFLGTWTANLDYCGFRCRAVIQFYSILCLFLCDIQINSSKWRSIRSVEIQLWHHNG